MTVIVFTTVINIARKGACKEPTAIFDEEVANASLTRQIAKDPRRLQQTLLVPYLKELQRHCGNRFIKSVQGHIVQRQRPVIKGNDQIHRRDLGRDEVVSSRSLAFGIQIRHGHLN